MMTRLIAIFIWLGLIIVTTGNKQQSECGPCKCGTVTSDLEKVDCDSKNLTEIPKYLSSTLQYFILNNNPIINLPKEVFKNASLILLQKLQLHNCSIKYIHRDAFKGLTILIFIDLSNNNIKHLSPGLFSSTAKLRTILLNNNYLEELENDIFHHLTYLQKIDLSYNRLREISDRAFHNVSELSTISLSDNNLTFIKLIVFNELPKLTSLDLQYNPWNCDCHMRKIHHWILSKNLYTHPTKCQQPEVLYDKSWNNITSDQFSCPPKIQSIYIQSINNYDYIDLGDTVTISCHAKGVPKPNIVWIHRAHVLNNSTKRPNDKKYIFHESHEWLNVTINDIILSDKGEYICKAENYGGNVERNVTISIVGDGDVRKKAGFISLPIQISLGLIFLLLVIIFITLCTWYCLRKKKRNDEKAIDTTSLEHHSLGEQEKSLITAINPVVKPPRRYEAPSVTSHGTEMTELNRTLLDNDSVFADGMGSVIGVVGGKAEDERERATPEFENGTLTCVTSYRQYPPDLLAFSGGRGASPTSQTSTLPDTTTTTTTSSRLPLNQQYIPTSYSGQYPAAFKTLPHNHRTGSTYNNNSPIIPVLPRHGYVTIPRRPRAPSWSSAPPGSPCEMIEPVYDNLGMRITANGSSVLSLNKSPEPGPISMRIRPLPNTPTSSHHSPYNSNTNTIQRSTPNILSQTPLDRSPPEGTVEWFNKLPDEMENRIQSDGSNTLGRKIPPRPPPKPKKKNNNGPLYEDEGEDGTEV